MGMEKGHIQECRRVGGIKWDATRHGGREEANGSTTFLFNEFDDKWKAKDLFFEFKELGEIDEVFTPPKRDRKGRRYGFDRYFNVKDERINDEAKQHVSRR